MFLPKELPQDASIACYRNLEEQAAGITVDTIMDLTTCEIVTEPMLNQLWPFALRTAKQHFLFAVQTEEERSSWIVDILKLRPLATLVGLTNDAAVGRFAATAACLLAVEKPDGAPTIVSTNAHTQLHLFVETNSRTLCPRPHVLCDASLFLLLYVSLTLWCSKDGAIGCQCANRCLHCNDL